MRNNLINMNRSRIVAGIVGLAMLGGAAGAQAGEGHWKHGRYGYYEPEYVFVPPGHVHYYAPRPVIVYPAPVYVPAYPVYAPPAYPGLNLNFNIPLR